MKIPTRLIHPDEPCYGLCEGPRGGRWIQAVYVVREGGDAIAEWTKDYGPVEDFEHIQPLMMPSDGENTVAQLQEWAEKNRHDHYWSHRREEMLAESTLIADVLRQDEERKQQIRNRSVFGPYFRRERNLHSQERTRRIIKEKQRANRI